MLDKIPWKKLLDQWPAKILSVAAALLLFFYNRIDTLGEKNITVPVRLITDTTLVPAENWTTRVKLTIRGPKDELAALSDHEIEAVADFSDRSGEGIYRAPVQIRRRGNAADLENLEIVADPMMLRLRLERRVIKTVPVVPQFSGQPGKDFELSGFRVSPSRITVEGPRVRMSKLKYVETEPIDLRGKTDNFTIKVHLELNSSLLDFPLGHSVEVYGNMRSSLQTMTFPSLQPQIVGLIPGLEVTIPPAPVAVRIRGTRQALAGLEADKVHVEADLTNFNGPGEAVDVPIRVLLPPGVDLVEVMPAVINLILEKKP